MRVHPKHSQRGANLLEFGLVSVVLIPLIFGAISLGMRLGTHIQTTQLARDACHMYARGLDFSKPANQDVLYTLGHSFGLGNGTGNAVVVLSQVRKVYPADCATIRGGCGNRDRHVVTHRIVLGDARLSASRLATPRPGIVSRTGTIATDDFLRDGTVALNAAMTTELFDRTGFNLSRGEVAYVVETFTPARETEMFGWVGTGGVYSRAIF
jgi:Flp pilus assembly protein TadG